MKYSEKINEDLRQAMKDRQKDKLEALRAVKTAFTLARSDKGAGSELTDEEEIKIMQKLVKQRKESAEIYSGQNRPELADKENVEAEYISEYLPEQMSEEDLTSYLQSLVTRLGASEMRDMGRVMGAATAELSGKADGKDISAVVRKLLQ
ncbi:MAG: GatB/YqeY domain-containing protein [Bacteroidales bacterium]|nr:GatB/YqeY domain-containing protein [Bacteroidales bacterium]